MDRHASHACARNQLINLDQFVSENTPQEGDGFQLENSKLLDVSLDGSVMAKAGSVVAYTGDLSFERKTGSGIAGMLKKKVTGEGSVMMQASGTGHLSLADQGKEVQEVELDAGEQLSVNGNDILAFGENVDWDIGIMDSIVGASTGRSFTICLTGPGYVAITTHGEPIVVPTPVRTDPQATVAYIGSVSPSAERDRNPKSFVGRSSGETYRLDVSEEDGFVIVQPSEEQTPTE